MRVCATEPYSLSSPQGFKLRALTLDDFFAPSNITGPQARASDVHDSAVAGSSQPGTFGTGRRGGLNEGFMKTSDLQGERPPTVSPMRNNAI